MTHYNDNMDEDVVCPWCGEPYLNILEFIMYHEDGFECEWCHKLFQVHIHFTVEKMET
jgi:hypothetical protein